MLLKKNIFSLRDTTWCIIYKHIYFLLDFQSSVQEKVISTKTLYNDNKSIHNIQDIT